MGLIEQSFKSGWAGLAQFSLFNGLLVAHTGHFIANSEQESFQPTRALILSGSLGCFGLSPSAASSDRGCHEERGKRDH